MIKATLKKFPYLDSLPKTAEVLLVESDYVELKDELGFTCTISREVFDACYEISRVDACEECEVMLEPLERKVCARCASSREHAGDLPWGRNEPRNVDRV